MDDAFESRALFATAAMAEILLGQDLVREALEIIERLHLAHPEDARVASLKERLAERLARGETTQVPVPERGVDRIALSFNGGALCVEWELSEAGLAVAKRKVRYSGTAIARLFTATVGPRGVRKSLSDLSIQHRAGRVELRGVPRPAVHAAAVGFLGRNGAFVPLSRSLPLSSGRA